MKSAKRLTPRERLLEFYLSLPNCNQFTTEAAARHYTPSKKNATWDARLRAANKYLNELVALEDIVRVKRGVWKDAHSESNRSPRKPKEMKSMWTDKELKEANMTNPCLDIEVNDNTMLADAVRHTSERVGTGTDLINGRSLMNPVPGSLGDDWDSAGNTGRFDEVPLELQASVIDFRKGSAHKKRKDQSTDRSIANQLDIFNDIHALDNNIERYNGGDRIVEGRRVHHSDPFWGREDLRGDGTCTEGFNQTSWSDSNLVRFGVAVVIIIALVGVFAFIHNF